jgi:hypothetical protein
MVFVTTSQEKLLLLVEERVAVLTAVFGFSLDDVVAFCKTASRPAAARHHFSRARAHSA